MQSGWPDYRFVIQVDKKKSLHDVIYIPKQPGYNVECDGFDPGKTNLWT